jgi:large subunit ribosomal protein LP0
MSGGDNSGKAKKQAYFARLIKLLDEYPCVLVVGADNVGSNHMQQIRRALRAKGAVLLMGKNTMIRKAIRGHMSNNQSLEALLPLIRGNIGFVFTKGELSEIKKIIEANRVEAPAKTGAIAPCKVVVPAMNTGLEPTQTSFFQALNIQTKIARGQIEITQDVNLIEEGQKVGASEANLLNKLNIKPFSYGLVLGQVYDHGSVYHYKVLNVTDQDILDKFNAGVRNIASLGLQIGVPSIASLPHSIARGFKNVLSVSLATDYTFDKAQKVKDFLKNPGAFAASAPAPAAKGGEAPAAKGGKAAPKEEPKEEKKEQSDEDMGFGLFD